MSSRANDGSKARSPYGPAYPALLALSGLFALGAVLTLIPFAGAPWPNILGYKSLCPFAPGATLACAILAALTCMIRARIVKRAPMPLFFSLTIIALITAGLAWSTAVWAAEKARYTDGTSAATARR
jgi:hypothetical protein